MRRFFVFLCLSLFLAIPSVSYAIGIEVSVGAWRQDPQGTLSYKPVALTDNMDLDRDLKYDTETRLTGRVKIDMPLAIPNIYLMATPMSFEGRGLKTLGNFKWGDKEFAVSQPFDSKIVLDHLDIALYYSLPFLKKLTVGKLNAELGLNARVIAFKAEISGTETTTNTTVTESKSFTLPVPMVYIGVQIMPVKALALEAEGRGVAYGGNHYYSVIGRLKIKVIGPLFIAGGWRQDDIKIDEKDVKAEFEFKGPFAEVGLKF